MSWSFSMAQRALTPALLSSVATCIILLAFVVKNCTSQATLRDGGTYTIRNIFNEKLLTVDDQGVIGLSPGRVVTASDRVDSTEQAWVVKWEPVQSPDHQGYWLQSRKDFLNTITSWYPPGRSTPVTNVWMLGYLGDGKWHIRNMRTDGCLQLFKNGIDIEDGKCTVKTKKQQWSFTRIIKYPIEDDEQHIIYTFRKVEFGHKPSKIIS